MKNFLAFNLLAIGTPMLLGGDEVRRTQHGNNNAYCQDSEISWFDWSLVEKHAGLLRFVKLLLACRRDPARDIDTHHGTLTEFLESAACIGTASRSAGPTGVLIPAVLRQRQGHPG